MVDRYQLFWSGYDAENNESMTTLLTGIVAEKKLRRYEFYFS